MRLLLVGDVMTGRGIDQILPHPGDPRLFEPFVRDARTYVELAEARHGPIPRPVAPEYVWGEALEAVAARAPAVRIANLETAVTARGTPAPKGIHYRMHPDNAGVLRAFALDVCALANNHVLDWGVEGLADTLATLDRLGIARAGAGRDLDEARRPAVVVRDGRRVLVFALAHPSSGVPPAWAARPDRPGVWFLGRWDAEAVAAELARHRRPGDLVVVSLHWGPNWGYAVPPEVRAFARTLVDRHGVAVVHGHSSHHPRAAEVRGRGVILYGCGDFLNDYEGIEGYESYRDDLVMAWLVAFDDAGRPGEVELLPFRIRRLRLEHPDEADRLWLAARLARECGRLGTRLVRRDHRLLLEPADSVHRSRGGGGRAWSGTGRG